MNVWNSVQMLQFAIAFCILVFGIFYLKLPWLYALTAVALSLPAPIIGVSNSSSGYLYLSDLCWLSLMWRAIYCPIKFLPLEKHIAFLAFIPLLLLPIISTCVASLFLPYFSLLDWLVDLYRGTGYLVIFLFGMWIARRPTLGLKMLLCSLLCFLLVKVCGIGQYVFDINLDLWFANNDEVKSWYEKGRNTTYGLGYMGLYRGAVGAWGALFLCLLPFISLYFKRLNLLLPIGLILIFAGIVSVGSRQGILFGILGFGLSTFLVTRFFREGRDKSMLTVFLVGASILLGLYIFQNSSDETKGWIAIRAASFDANRVGAQETLSVFLRSPMVLIGVGNQQPHQDPLAGSDDPYRFAYADSELVWTIQETGVIGLAFYFYFLFRVFKVLLSFKVVRLYEHKVIVLCSMMVLALAALFCIGHFSLLHTASSQAPISYWEWGILGMGIGSVAQYSRKNLDYANSKSNSNRADVSPKSASL